MTSSQSECGCVTGLPDGVHPVPDLRCCLRPAGGARHQVVPSALLPVLVLRCASFHAMPVVYGLIHAMSS